MTKQQHVTSRKSSTFHFFPLILSFNSQVRDITASIELLGSKTLGFYTYSIKVSNFEWHMSAHRMITTSMLYFGDLMFGLVDVAVPWKPYDKTSGNPHAANISTWSSLTYGTSSRNKVRMHRKHLGRLHAKSLNWNVPPTLWMGCWLLASTTTSEVTSAKFILRRGKSWVENWAQLFKCRYSLRS